jgi:hypothetical protein
LADWEKKRRRPEEKEFAKNSRADIRNRNASAIIDAASIRGEMAEWLKAAVC